MVSNAHLQARCSSLLLKKKKIKKESELLNSKLGGCGFIGYDEYRNIRNNTGKLFEFKLVKIATFCGYKSQKQKKGARRLPGGFSG
jgi:hypothetical protein